MEEYVCLEGELRFRLKPRATIDSLVSTFSAFFMLGKGWRDRFRAKAVVARVLIPGRVGIIVFQRRWYKFKPWRLRIRSLQGGGAASLLGGAVLLFYVDRDRRGRVAVHGFMSERDVSTVGAFQESFRGELPRIMRDEVVSRFLKEECRNLIQLDGDPSELSESFIHLDEEDLVEYASQAPPPVAESQPETRQPTPISFCPKCDTAIAIDGSSYCWNCGTKLKPTEDNAVTVRVRRVVSAKVQDGGEVFERKCVVCKSVFEEGALLAWCPHCGAAAHEVHMLEWLHVNGKCPACSQHLSAAEVSEQLSLRKGR